jgi:predicted MPP superfamily phosphohydrolase
VAHLVPALAACAWLPWTLALPLTVALWLGAARRVHMLGEDRPRPAWVVRWIDEPLFWHWGACAYGLVLLGPVLGLLALMGAGGQWSAIARDDFVGRLARAGSLAYFGGAVVSAWSLWGIRRRLRVVRCEVPVVGLAPEYDGYRVVQLSDLHVGSYDSKARALGWAARANALSADLCVVTGDFVTSGTGFYRDAADVVATLRSTDGVLAVLGNHDQWDSELLCAELRRRQIPVLANDWVLLSRGSGQLVVAGVGDRRSAQEDLDAALAGRPPNAPTILLSHDPAVGDEAAARGVELVLSGHTHGGQFGLPGIANRVNLTPLMGQPRSGLRRRGELWQFVSAGLGTTGPPLRLGIAPEIALLVLQSRPGNMVPER